MDKKKSTQIQNCCIKGCTLTNCTSVHAGFKQPPLGESHRGHSVLDIGYTVSVFFMVSLFCFDFALDPNVIRSPSTYRLCCLLVFHYNNSPCGPQLLF